MRIQFTFLIIILSLPTYANENSVIGKWTLVKSSFEIPKECSGLWYKFTNKGKLISGDGSLKEMKKYQLVDYKQGMHIKTTYVANNGKPNCQGLDSSYVKENTFQVVYAEFVKKTGELKIFFGSEPDGNYILLRKE